MRLLQAKFSRVFNGDNAIGFGYERRQDIKRCCLAGAGAAAYQNIQPRTNARIKECRHIVAKRAEAHKVLNR